MDLIQTEEEELKIKNWIENHNKTCIFYGKNFPRFEYRIRPTGLGPIESMICDCGASLDLTESDKW